MIQRHFCLFKMVNKILCFDLDNTICKTVRNFYKKSTPYKSKISLINALYKKGYEIKIFTSRFMGRNNDNQKKAIKSGYFFTKKQLDSWGLKYHKLILGKPSYDVLIDDKSLFFKKNWSKYLLNKLKNK